MTKDIDELAEKIKKAQAIQDDPAHNPARADKDEDPNVKAGVHAGLEFVGAILIPTLVGYWIDQWLGTSPAFLLILFFLGICTGFYNIWRITQNLGTAVGFSQLHPDKKDVKSTSDLSESGHKEE